MTALITTGKLTKSIAQGASRVWLLRDVDLTIEDGDFVSISGPSGAGKSTLLHILGLHDAEWEGTYALDGHDIRALSGKQRADLQRRTIGFVFQSYHLIDDLTVAENLEVPLRYRDIAKSERQSLVADSLDRFRIVGKKDLYPSQLSGGQQQLVGIARAVIANPKLILADEPPATCTPNRRVRSWNCSVSSIAAGPPSCRSLTPKRTPSTEIAACVCGMGG
jgi:putative ABC transport system ATP-binding protein